MSDLISREALVEDLSYCAPELFFDKDFLLYKIMRQPAIDAAPVEPKRRILSRLGSKSLYDYKCGACGKDIEMCDKYCWNCGKEVKWDD